MPGAPGRHGFFCRQPVPVRNGLRWGTRYARWGTSGTILPAAQIFRPTCRVRVPDQGVFMPRPPPLSERIDDRFVLIDSEGRERFPYRERRPDGVYSFVVGTGKSGGERVFVDDLAEVARLVIREGRPLTVIRRDGTGHAGVFPPHHVQDQVLPDRSRA